MSDASPAETVRISIEEKPRNTVTFQPLGLRPYLLIEVHADDSDDGEFTLDVTTGGGFPDGVDEIPAHLAMAADLVRAGLDEHQADATKSKKDGVTE